MKKEFWTKTPVIVGMTFLCCLLWGSAFPCVKTGYRLFSIGAEDAAAQILFAGIRFILAGVMVVVFGSLHNKRLLLPKKTSAGPVLILALFQTIGQYYFFYAGMAHTSGVMSSIMVATGTFFSILFSTLIFRYERMTIWKIIGCLIGFTGVVLIQVPNGIDMGFHMNGEGFILLSSVMYAFSAGFVKRFSEREDPLVLSGWQFLAGGLVLTVGGLLAGGRLHAGTPAAGVLLLYMAFISAGAYSLWSILLKHNPVSRVAIFGFMNPVIGVILSAVILGEQNQAFTVFGLSALVLVSLGIILVNRKKETGRRDAPVRKTKAE